MESRVTDVPQAQRRAASYPGALSLLDRICDGGHSIVWRDMTIAPW
jgi:hypothetical protein